MYSHLAETPCFKWRKNPAAAKKGGISLRDVADCANSVGFLGQVPLLPHFCPLSVPDVGVFGVYSESPCTGLFGTPWVCMLCTLCRQCTLFALCTLHTTLHPQYSTLYTQNTEQSAHQRPHTACTAHCSVHKLCILTPFCSNNSPISRLFCESMWAKTDQKQQNSLEPIVFSIPKG